MRPPARTSPRSWRRGALLALPLFIALVASASLRAQDPQPTAAEIEKIESALPGAAPAEPREPRKLLVFSVTRGYRHSAIPFGKKAIALMGQKTGAFEAVISDDPAQFEPRNLAQYDAVMLNNTNNEVFLPANVDELPPAQQESSRKRARLLRESLASFVSRGKGLVVIHAGIATFRKWPLFGQIMGARFDNHPWNSGSTVTLKVEEPDHPVACCFGGDRFTVTDEIYQFKEYSRDRLRVLLSLDTARTDMQKGERIHRTDGDFALSWVKPFGKGRVFYCALGHDHAIYWNPAVLRHFLGGIQFALGDLEAPATPRPAAPRPRFHAADLVALAQRFRSYSDELPAARQLGVEEILAFEENPHFVYIRGRGPAGERRVVFCKPATFVVQDLPAAANSWELICESAPRIEEERFVVEQGRSVLTGRILRPEGRLEAARRGDSHLVRAKFASPRETKQFLHSLHIGEASRIALPVEASIDASGTATVKVASGDHSFDITLPATGVPGSIAVFRGDEAVLPERVLPAGILPHGEAGVRMLQRWDRAYRLENKPPWDAGYPDPELRRVIESGKIQPGRAMVLGCGAGTNAIYLASQGFDVTGVDLAPTALSLARQRASHAGVKVRWLLADARAVPVEGPFDFIFDRGCYHGVRRHDAAGYVASVRRLSREGTRFLVLAGNANEPRHYGPPRVEETAIVDDFASSWDFVWLRELTPGPDDPDRAWFWSVLLRRKAPGGEPGRR